MSIAIDELTGIVLAGESDQGLRSHLGMPLALNALLRLSPQVGHVMINANRHLAAYESMGAPVWPDALSDIDGPLAGLLTGLEHCDTAWLVGVPCDAPDFPQDLVERLCQGAADPATEIVFAATRDVHPLQRHTRFCLLRSSLLESLMAFLHGGGRHIQAWAIAHHCADVEFDDAQAFRSVASATPAGRTAR